MKKGKNLLLNIKFDSEHFYGDNDKQIKTKIKIYARPKKYQKKKHHASAYQ